MYWKTEYTEDITCPHCGYIEKDSWEAPDESDDYICSNCNMDFLMCRNIEITYSTFKKDKKRGRLI